MERTEILVDILRDQLRKGAPRESVLWTLGMIRNEVLQMPSAHQEPVAPVPADELASGQDAVDSRSDTQAMALGNIYADSASPSTDEQAMPTQNAVVEDSRVVTRAMVMPPSPGSDSVEVNQAIAMPAASLNDMLRKEQAEVAQSLRPMASLDLRQAVGINDRFRFINELFLGDAALFDLAIGELNEVRDYQAAALWIEQSLPAARTWNPEDALVRQFHGLLRSRFV